MSPCSDSSSKKLILRVETGDGTYLDDQKEVRSVNKKKFKRFRIFIIDVTVTDYVTTPRHKFAKNILVLYY